MWKRGGTAAGHLLGCEGCRVPGRARPGFHQVRSWEQPAGPLLPVRPATGGRRPRRPRWGPRAAAQRPLASSLTPHRARPLQGRSQRLVAAEDGPGRLEGEPGAHVSSHRAEGCVFPQVSGSAGCGQPHGGIRLSPEKERSSTQPPTPGPRERCEVRGLHTQAAGCERICEVQDGHGQEAGRGCRLPRAGVGGSLWVGTGFYFGRTAGSGTRQVAAAQH